jgi:hypothetical protein
MQRHAPDPLMMDWLVCAQKGFQIMSLDDEGCDEHRPEHRTQAMNEAASLGAGALSPMGGVGPSALDMRSDRRKYLIPDKDVDTVLEACRRGVSEVRIARGLGINFRTWQRVRVEDERVASALTETRTLEEDELVALLMDKARGGETTAIIFALKGRHGYRDHGTPAVAAEARVNIQINLPAASATVEDYARIIDGHAS